MEHTSQMIVFVIGVKQVQQHVSFVVEWIHAIIVSGSARL